MRRCDRQTSVERAWKIFNTAPFATLSMTNADNTPYCIPISPAAQNNCVYFHCANLGQKLDILVHNNTVCISAVSSITEAKETFSVNFSSAVLNGTASIVQDEAEKIKALRLISQRHTPKDMPDFENAIAKYLKVTTIVRIDVTEITGKEKTEK